MSKALEIFLFVIIELTKTECILLGNLKNKNDEIDGIKVTNGAVKCLGIYLEQNHD